jgi:hypothetical protein
LVQDATKRRDLYREVSLFHRGTRPNSGHDLILRDEFAAPVDQCAQDIDGTRTKVDRFELIALGASKQPTCAPVEAELLE